jgi:predicted nucleic acid-binding Zn ribbon protein
VPTDDERTAEQVANVNRDQTRDQDTAVTGATAESDGAATDGTLTGDPATDLAATDPSPDPSDGEAADTAAASALARAREAARARGLHPGSRPMRRRNPDQSGGTVGSESRKSRTDGRDPSLLGDQMNRLLLDRGWNVDVAIGSVMGRWPAIVGVEVAAHCTPVTFSDGVLIVRADSTAWATQLRLMSSSILGRLETEVGKDAVTELRVQGPGAPSWTRGPRKSTGPGPRDTYG